YKASAAHKILPLDTIITVTNIENNKTISLIVNDRGPFVPGRVLDLSYGAAKQLAITDKGLARVVIKTSGKVKGQYKNDLVGNFFIHIGAFEKKSDANSLIADMRLHKYKKSMMEIVETTINNETNWHVEYGPFKSMAAANKAHSLIQQDYPSAFVHSKKLKS
ncbi:MAG: septal ring lytic transglycosylase RlpA family protein, partial [Smithella sp.]